MLNLNKGLFIAVEGIEGVGKSTAIRVISEVCQKKFAVVKTTREPGGTPIAEEVRRLLKQTETPVDINTELLLMFAARANHIEQVIKPHLAEHACVISDRFIDSSYAYQGGGRGVPKSTIQFLDQLVCHDCQPDITVLLTCPVLMTVSRVKARGEALDRIETEDEGFFQRAQDAYLEKARGKPGYFILDASLPLKEVSSQLEEHLSCLLKIS